VFIIWGAHLVMCVAYWFWNKPYKIATILPPPCGRSNWVPVSNQKPIAITVVLVVFHSNKELLSVQILSTLNLTHVTSNFGSSIAQAVSRRLPKSRPGFESRSRDVRSVVDKVTLGQVLSEYFGFLCQFSLHRLLHIHHHLSSMVGTIGQLIADVPSGLSLTPHQETKRNHHKISLGSHTCNSWLRTLFYS
jgi:hypothetical protein